MSDVPAKIPEGYEIVKTISTSDMVGEYIARHRADEIDVRLKIFSFSVASGATIRRHSREQLRSDITYMEELDRSGIIRLFDYSDSKNRFWIATRPAEIDKLSDCFDFLVTQSVEFRQKLVYQFLSVLQWIHEQGVVHRNISGNAVFLTPKHEIYIGDFGLAGHMTDRPTIPMETVLVTTTSYLPPEIRAADTFTCNAGCDVFSAGLLAFEILSATPLPQNNPDQINEILNALLKEQTTNGIITTDTADVILKAANLSPEKRWLSARDFAEALKTAQTQASTPKTAHADQMMTMAITDSTEAMQTAPDMATTRITPQPSEPAGKAEEAAVDNIKPLDPSHEIWNNHYEILEKIGEGGQAVVYKAYDHLTNEEIAIKTIWSRHRRDRAAINRLKQGAMIARSLTHRHIIKTYSVEQRTDSDSVGRYVFICMELVGSKLDLAHVIETRKNTGTKISLKETLHIIHQLLDALMYAHEYTIHRDIKPGNIMLVPRDKQTSNDISDLTKFDIKLIDFGIAKVLSQKHIDVTGKGFRSAYYGAPELADTRTGVDARADIYSVGVIMYQMLTNNIPRKGSPPANKVNKDVPAALAKVIDHSISTDREKRFKTIAEFIKEINRAVSKFNWLRKAAKIAAVILIIGSIAAAVKYFLPEKERLPVRQSMKLLQNRDPNVQIASLANAPIVKYEDIEGYNSYNSLRLQALGGLKTAEDLGTDTFDTSYSPWKKQQEVWSTVKPAVKKIEQIAQYQQLYYEARKDLDIINRLKDLPPSSEIVTDVTQKAKTAETLLQARPIPQETINVCAESYDLAANVYMNIRKLASDSDTPQTAEQINDEFKNVGQLRQASLFSRKTIETVEQLKESGFHEHSEKCFNKADRYYNTFELQTATKYYDLLSQICGTMAHVRDKVDFSGSKIGLISTRLMDLCYEDVDTFENYPAWKEKLELVYKNKDIAAKYTLLRNLLLKSPRDIPLNVYNHVDLALQQYRQNNLDSAAAQLIEAVKQYKNYAQQKIRTLMADCDSLTAFPSVPKDKIGNCENDLERLLNVVNESPWPEADFADEFNRCSQQVTEEKDTVRKQLTQNARHLRKSIIDSRNKAQQQDFFWQSQRIGKYMSVARQYDNEQIEAVISNWIYVENLSRLTVILNQMEVIDSLLEKMLLRKEQLDGLSADIDKAVTFCRTFKGISAEETEKYRKYESDLKQLKAEITVPKGNVYLIDQTDNKFTAGFSDIHNAFSEIRAKLPFHRSRVIELINKTHSLEKKADNIDRLRQHWAGIFGDSVLPRSKPDFTQTRRYLESVKEDVDNWSPERFNRQMRQKCNILADTLHKQNQILASITSAVLNEKSRLLKAIDSYRVKVNEILNDSDIRALEALASADNRQGLQQFRQIPNLLEVSRNKITNIALDSLQTESSLSVSNPADFEINSWIILFNKNDNQLNSHIKQLRAVNDSALTFREIRELLAGQSAAETEYYTGLRDYTLSLINYSDVSDKIDAVTSDSDSIKMCRFLEQVQDDSVPNLTAVKNTVSKLADELIVLKSKKISSLAEAKEFNSKRRQFLQKIETLQSDLQKLDKTNIENTCKQAVVGAVDTIKNLIGNPDQSDKLGRLTTSLWKFYPEHKSWQQWLAFLQLHHIKISNDDILLTSFEFLRPVNEKGTYLTLPEIAANPEKIFSFNAANPANFGWPYHVTHQKDPTVILAFVPASSSTQTGPFYMATREITNAQYKLFLEKTGAKSPTNMAGWAYFTDNSGENRLIIQSVGQYPPSRITWNKSNSTFVLDEDFKNAPVTWITSNGAKAYADWFDAKLPTVAQHTYAARCGNQTKYPWGDDFSGAASYAHVRSTAWQNAARQYNAKRDDPVEIAYPPVGAVKDFLRGEALEPSLIALKENDNHPVWPYFTENNKPNTWGLYDMIGNVWEWCLDMQNNSRPVICGGSCLSPPDYISPGSKYEFEAQACDVGFRIAIPLK